MDIPKRKCFAKRLLKKIYHKTYRVFILSIISICIKKLCKSIPVTTFVGGIKNFAKQGNTCEKWVISRPGQAEYVAGLKEVTWTDKSSQNPMKMLTVIWNKQMRDVCSEVKDILTNEFINPFSNDMDKTKLCNIASGTFTFNDISQCLPTIFERVNTRMV